MSFTRGHRKQESSFGGGYGSTLPPLTISNTLALHLGFAIQGAQDAAKLTAAGQKVASDKVHPLPSLSFPCAHPLGPHYV